MLCSDIREVLAEEEEVQRRKDALESLVRMRSKQLRESLEERISRAQNDGEWIHLSQKDCAALHKQEKLYLKSQVDRLRDEQARTRGRLAALRRAKARAKHIRAAEVAYRKRH
jgi:hypothetical protein